MLFDIFLYVKSGCHNNFAHAYQARYVIAVKTNYICYYFHLDNKIYIM